jgi:hypothetical protein
VVVQVDRADGGQAGKVAVTVYRETFATPERQFNNSAATLRIFGETLPGVAGEPLLTRAHDYWIDAGRDGVMERRLLDRILARAGLSAEPMPAAP